MYSANIVPVDPHGSEACGSTEKHHPNNSYTPDTPLRVQIPQPPYIYGVPRGWIQKPPILFSTMGCPGVKLVDALERRIERIDDRDGFPFGEDCDFTGITIRIHFLGYPSSTEVEKKLNELAKNPDGDRKAKAKSMQLSTKNYKKPRGPATRSKLVQEISKRICWHINDLLANADLFPFDYGVGEIWRLDSEQGIKFEHTTITGLDNVSGGSWSPVLWINRPDSSRDPADCTI